MNYTFTQKNLTLQDANRALLLLWGTIDDDNVDPTTLTSSSRTGFNYTR